MATPTATALYKAVANILKDASPQQVLQYVVPLVAAYPILASLLRFRNMKQIHKKYNYPTRESFARMTDEDAFEIQKNLIQYEFPFFFTKALQFALFRTYGIPTISRTLTKTSQFSGASTYLKRYTDTSALVQEFVGQAPSAARGQAAIVRTRYLHSGYRSSGMILDDDMLYTLGLFAVQPVRFIQKYEWRELTDVEKCAIGTFWKSVGDGLEVSYDALPSGKTGFRDGLQWLEEIMAWSDAYEEKCMLPDEKNREVADQTTAVLVYLVPKPAQHIGIKFVSFMMDDRLRKAMLYDAPPASYAGIFRFVLSARRFVMRYLALPRPYFLRHTTFTERQSVNERIFITQWDGAPYYVKPTIWNRWGPAAWYTWALGRPLPGDEGDKYYPDGYYIADVGPTKFEGKGRKNQLEGEEALKVSRTGGCPFG
ncbi:hypothetical protein ASPSYDRAFT_83555 [Aspergillus sydowii CBS 593.65]|uniref:Uncharacterized protein n=1 Tax=Aspergillus sydowii CBS 593.65 TaxID=1036612 RepID=A0A1L9TW26_9EURO|nr:uncharacterized protein ASPSYDRAFT_83555 [Aspergillus sydowii CBS 593.65]OJJ63493.1 hypothetical protein ASPSYDRAFT_83555 [Aspergillus sydowii CBS 593.65]